MNFSSTRLLLVLLHFFSLASPSILILPSNSFLIDYGALHLSLPLTDLLLQNGADPNIQSPKKCPHPDLQSPRKCALSLALRELCVNNAYIKQWRPGKSIFKLLYIFCLPDLNEPFATIKLLASHTKQIESVLTHFIKMGDVAELAALLMAAKDQLLVPSAEGGLETTPIGQYILEKVKLESEQEGQVTNDSEPTNIVLAKPIVEPYKKHTMSSKSCGKLLIFLKAIVTLNGLRM